MYEKNNIFKKSKYLNLLGETFFMFDKNSFDYIKGCIPPDETKLLNALVDIMQLLEYFFLEKLSNFLLYSSMVYEKDIFALLQNLVNNWDNISKNEYQQWRKKQKDFYGGQKWS